MPEPAVELAYHFEGDGTNHAWGVCFNVASATACNPAQPANVAFMSTASSPVTTPGAGWVVGADEASRYLRFISHFSAAEKHDIYSADLRARFTGDATADLFGLDLGW